MTLSPTLNYPQFPALSLQRWSVISLELLLALPLGLVLTNAGIGGMARFLGGMVAGAVVLYTCRVSYNLPVQPNRTLRKIGQALVGLGIGFAIADADFSHLTAQLPIFILLAVLMLLGGTGIGYLYARLSKTNLMTSMLATAPGGVTLMPSIAADYNKNVALVSFVQIIRLTTVIALVPLVVRFMAPLDTSSPVSLVPQTAFVADPLHLLLLLLVLGLTFAATQLATYGKIPAAPFFGSILAGSSFTLLLHGLPFLAAIDFHLPWLVNFIGQVLLGISIGEYWGTKPQVEKAAVKYSLLSVLLTLGVGLLIAAIALVLTPWDWLTCMLLAAPGGAPEMILVALTLHHNVEVVTTGHLVRLVAMNCSLPVWVLLVSHLDQRLPGMGNEP